MRSALLETIVIQPKNNYHLISKSSILKNTIVWAQVKMQKSKLSSGELECVEVEADLVDTWFLLLTEKVMVFNWTISDTMRRFSQQATAMTARTTGFEKRRASDKSCQHHQEGHFQLNDFDFWL